MINKIKRFAKLLLEMSSQIKKEQKVFFRIVSVNHGVT